MRRIERRHFKRRLQDRQRPNGGRKRAREALRVSEARLREAQAVAHVGSWELDLQTQTLVWSDEVYRIFELDPVQFGASYEAFLAAIHPDDRALVNEVFRRSVAEHQPYAIDHRLSMPDGRIKYVHERGMTYYDADDKPLRSVGTVQDITERRQAEEALREKSVQLTERLKELHCINEVSNILGQADAALEDLLPRAVRCIPPAWLHPDVTVARIELDGRVYVSDSFQETAWRMTQDIIVGGKTVGLVEVCYLEQRPDADEGPFLKEERDLIRLIAGKVELVIERRREEGRFRRLLETAPDAMVIVDPDGRIVLVNAQTERLFGYPRTELIGQPVELLMPERYVAAHLGHRAQYRRHPAPRPMGAGSTLYARRRDGSEFPVEISLGPLGTANGALISAAIRDITERRRAEVALQRLSRMRAMMSEINAMIVRVRDREELFDAACRIAVDRGGLRMAWIGIAEASGTVRPASCYGLDRGYVAQAGITVDAAEARGRGPSASALREGRNFIVNDIATDPMMVPWRTAALERGYRALASLPLQVNQQVVGVINLYAGEAGFFDDQEVELMDELAADVSFAMQSIEQRRQLDYLAYYDPLTQLANRSLFMERLGQFAGVARADRHQLALLVLDLERFKALNDALGMAAGDTLLRAVAQRLLRLAGGAECVARIGGDRFALIVPRIGRAADLSGLLREQIWAVLGEPLALSGEDYHPAARIGIALFPDDGSDAGTLFHNAEAALKKAKADADRYLFYTPEMNRAVHERLSLEGRIRRAVEQRELELYYQPKLDLRSGAVSGVEALLRWTAHEPFRTGGADLVRVLEETGGIVEVGRWALQQALADRQRWREAGLQPPPVAVNVSMLQLQQAGFIDDLTAVLAAAPAAEGDGAPGLELELTESTLMQDVEVNIARLRRVRELSIPIAIDDFGSGYSSLSYLSRLPISVLKIDRTFISAIADGSHAASIVAAIISLAHTLNLKVVAEGVETTGQLHFLGRLGCDQIQGFLFSAALSPAALAGFLLHPPVLPQPD